MADAGGDLATGSRLFQCPEGVTWHTLLQSLKPLPEHQLLVDLANIEHRHPDQFQATMDAATATDAKRAASFWEQPSLPGRLSHGVDLATLGRPLAARLTGWAGTDPDIPFSTLLPSGIDLYFCFPPGSGSALHTEVLVREHPGLSIAIQTALRLHITQNPSTTMCSALKFLDKSLADCLAAAGVSGLEATPQTRPPVVQPRPRSQAPPTGAAAGGGGDGSSRAAVAVPQPGLDTPGEEEQFASAAVAAMFTLPEVLRRLGEPATASNPFQNEAPARQTHDGVACDACTFLNDGVAAGDPCSMCNTPLQVPASQSPESVPSEASMQRLGAAMLVLEGDMGVLEQMATTAVAAGAGALGTRRRVVVNELATRAQLLLDQVSAPQGTPLRQMRKDILKRALAVSERVEA